MIIRQVEKRHILRAIGKQGENRAYEDPGDDVSVVMVLDLGGKGGKILVFF